MSDNEEKYGIVVSITESENEEPRKFLFQYGIYELDEDEREDENEPDFLPQAVVTVRELSEEDLDLLDANTNEDELGTLVCTLDGWLIISNFMKSYGYDPHYLCDAESQDLEYCWSALTDPAISALFTATYNNTDYTFDTNYYYTGMTSNNVTYIPASGNSAMFVVTVSSSADISADLTCKLEFE